MRREIEVVVKPLPPGPEATRVGGEQGSAGEPLPPDCELIEVHVAEPKQLFNAMDPSPFREKDLDPDAEEFIVGWAREVPREVPLARLVHLDRPAGLPVLRDAIREFFSHRAESSRRRLRQLFRLGRTSLLIGLMFLAVSIALGDVVASAMSGRRLGELLRESLLIGGWVAMWRPLEIFLYDWWPIRAEARLYDRLSAMPVRVAYTTDASSEALGVGLAGGVAGTKAAPLSGRDLVRAPGLSVSAAGQRLAGYVRSDPIAKSGGPKTLPAVPKRKAPRWRRDESLLGWLESL